MAASGKLKERVLSLLKEDDEFRLAVAGLLGLYAILDELKKLREDFNTFAKEQERRWEENNRKWEMAEKRFEVIELELKKLREDFNRLYESVMGRMDAFEKRLIALGARWGVESEVAFREAMKGIVEKPFGAGRVERWVYEDREGEVFGYPSQVEVDLLVKDEVHVLVEVKSSASEADVAKLWRIGNLYARAMGVRPKLALVTPFIDARGLEAARKLGVEVYTSL